jgi:hypothetical protein
MNPDMIDGIKDPRDGRSLNSSRLALRAEAIVKRLDPSRIVYHHDSGNLGSMHTTNFYPNFVPMQEVSDWFEHWATQGQKPVFTCEYGAPFILDWTMYRGWYQSKRAFGNAKVPWEFCLAEWNLQFLGDRAFQIDEIEKANLRWEARQFRSGNLWHHWDYPHMWGSRDFDERYPIIGMYLADNWRALRTWGVSANSPWEYGIFWKLRVSTLDVVQTEPRPLQVFPVYFEHIYRSVRRLPRIIEYEKVSVSLLVYDASDYAVYQCLLPNSTFCRQGKIRPQNRGSGSYVTNTTWEIAK